MLKDIWSASMTKIVRMEVWILVISLEQRSQWMALPILLQQVLVRFYDTTTVQKWIMVWWYMIIAYFMMQKVLMHSFILQKLLRFVLPSLQQKYIFQNILLFTFLSTLCAETYSNCNSVQMFMNLGFDFWQKRKIELFILLISSIVKKDLTISTK